MGQPAGDPVTRAYTRLDWKREPQMAAARTSMAQSYRKMREDNPAMARLLFKRLRAAGKDIADAWYRDAMEIRTQTPPYL